MLKELYLKVPSLTLTTRTHDSYALKSLSPADTQAVRPCKLATRTQRYSLFISVHSQAFSWHQPTSFPAFSFPF